MSPLVVSWFEVTNLQNQFGGVFLVGGGQEMTPGSVVECVANIVNVVVSLGFTFSRI